MCACVFVSDFDLDVNIGIAIWAFGNFVSDYDLDVKIIIASRAFATLWLEPLFEDHPV